MIRAAGYCYLCNTVYDKPHECGIKVGDKRCTKCWRLEAAEMQQASNNLKMGVEINNVYANDVWNQAIEAAAGIAMVYRAEVPLC